MTVQNFGCAAAAPLNKSQVDTTCLDNLPSEVIKKIFFYTVESGNWWEAYRDIKKTSRTLTLNLLTMSSKGMSKRIPAVWQVINKEKGTIEWAVCKNRPNKEVHNALITKIFEDLIGKDESHHLVRNRCFSDSEYSAYDLYSIFLEQFPELHKSFEILQNEDILDKENLPNEQIANFLKENGIVNLNS